MSKFDGVLRAHLQSPGPHYLSPKIQNELIQCCDTEIREKIITECNMSECFAICADETTDVSIKEQLHCIFMRPICRKNVSEGGIFRIRGAN